MKTQDSELAKVLRSRAFVWRMIGAVISAASALFYSAYSAFAMARGFNVLLILLLMILPLLFLVLSLVFFLWGASLVIVAQGRGAAEADHERAPGSS